MCRLAEIAKEQRRLEESRREEEEKKRLEEEREEREIERAAELKKEEAASAAAAARAGECSAPAAHLRIDCLKCVRMCVRACARARARRGAIGSAHADVNMYVALGCTWNLRITRSDMLRKLSISSFCIKWRI